MPEQGQELGPGPVALIHRVGVAALVLDQPREQAGDRVVADEQVVGRKHLALLGVEQEHQPHQDREQPFVDIVGAVGPVAQAREELAPRFLVGRLEPFQQLEQGGEHLLGELGGDLVLILAALGQDRGAAAGGRAGPWIRSWLSSALSAGAGQPAGGLQQGFEREA